MRCVLLCMLEVVEGELCSPEVMEVLEVFVLEALKVLDVPEVARCVLLCILEAVEGGVCSLEVLDVLDVPEAMRCVLLCMLEDVEGGLGLRG